MSAEGWNALGQMLLGVGALGGGAWALFNHHRTRRFEAARWLQGVFRDFYLSNRFDDVRELLEYNYPERAGPLLERRITDRHVPITVDEMRLLQDLDTLLNYFEHVIYLEDEHHFSRKDRQAVFEYWFDIMNSPHRASLRRYAARYGWERVTRTLNAEGPEYVAVYGSLRYGFGLSDAPDVEKRLTDRGPCLIHGVLFDLGDYPGLVFGSGRVIGELYEIEDLDVLKETDKYERYDALKPDESLFIRRVVRLAEPDVDAWVYFYNGDVDGFAQIGSGDWALHKGSGS